MIKINREIKINSLKHNKIHNVITQKFKLSRQQKIIQLKCYLKLSTTFKQIQ